jgi:DNA polymerase
MIVTIDFETYYDQDYTLKKMSTSEYVRDGRFEVLNCAIKMGDGPVKVVWGHDRVGRALKKINWAKHELLAHHAHFEGLILSHHYGIAPCRYRDTLSMGRALFAKTEKNRLEDLAKRLGVANKLQMPDFVGKREADLTPEERAAVEEYVAGDVESCAQAYAKMVGDMPQAEMDLIDITVRMFAEPVLRLDVKRAEAELARERQAKAAAIAKAKIDPADLTRNEPFAAALRALGIEPPKKISKTPGKDGEPKLIYAFAQTDNDFTSLVNHRDPLVVALVEARLAAKSTIGETRAMRLLKAGRARRRIPVYLNYCGAHTLRWSGGDKLNFQNFPRGGELRKCIVAPPGQVIVVVDSSQIEARVLAWLAGELWLLEAFRDKQDPYCIFGTKAYGRVITKADKEERQISKICVLGLGYSMGAFKLQLQLSWAGIHLPIEVCEGFVKVYRSSNRAIQALWETLNDAIGDMSTGRTGSLKCLSWNRDAIYLPNGLTLHYPHTRATIERRGHRMFSGPSREIVMDGSYDTPRGRSKLYGGLMTENVVQALARCIVGEFMRIIAQRYRVVMMSHDEVAYLAPKRAAQQALDFGLEVFRAAPKWAPGLPLDAEGGFDVMYSK